MSLAMPPALPGDELSVERPQSNSLRALLSRKRVGMVTYSAYPADPRPRRAVATLLAEGVSVDLICLADDENPARQQLDRLRIRRIPITHRRGGKLSYAYQYAAFILASASILALRCLWRRYDLIYIHNMPDVLVASALVPKLRGAKVVLDLHDPMPELMTTIFNLDRESSAVKLIRKLEKWSIAQADLVLTVNIACKRIFAGRSCPAGKIGVIMNAPDPDIFRFQPPRQRVSDRFVIMYHGSIVERNGLDLAVEAMAKVRRVVPKVELRIFGRRTPFLDSVMDHVRDQQLGEHIHYLGARSLEGLVGEIENSDLGIIPNQRNEFTDINTPTRIFEYLAAGKPVIAPSTRGIQDYFGPESLVFFEAGDADDLAAKIEQVYLNPIRTINTVKRGQEVYAAHTWPQEKQSLLTLIAKLLNESRVRPR